MTRYVIVLGWILLGFGCASEPVRCGLGGDCPTGICFDGFCADPCETDGDCAEPTLCSPILAGGAGACLPGCEEDSSSLCIDGRRTHCDLAARGSHCSNCGCPEGMFCDQYNTNSCFPKFELGAPCQDCSLGRCCASGFCGGGICTIGAPGEGCEQGWDCQSSLCQPEMGCQLPPGTACTEDETSCECYAGWCRSRCDNDTVSNCPSGWGCLGNNETNVFYCYRICDQEHISCPADTTCRDRWLSGYERYDSRTRFLCQLDHR